MARPFTAETWAVEWVRREGGDLGAMLSPLLVLRRERAVLLESLGELPSEAAVRTVVADFNHRLLEEYRRGNLKLDELVTREYSLDEINELRRRIRVSKKSLLPPRPANRRAFRAAIANFKGGAGKSTVALHFAHAHSLAEIFFVSTLPSISAFQPHRLTLPPAARTRRSTSPWCSAPGTGPVQRSAR